MQHQQLRQSQVGTHSLRQNAKKCAVSQQRNIGTQRVSISRKQIVAQAEQDDEAANNQAEEEMIDINESSEVMTVVDDEDMSYATPITKVYLGRSKHRHTFAEVKISPGTGRYIVHDMPLEEWARQIYPDRTLNAVKRVSADKMIWYMTHPLRKVYGEDAVPPVDVEVLTAHKFQEPAWYSRCRATRVALARALAKADPAKKEYLDSLNLTTRDRRMPERKKPGKHAARRAVQFSKR